MAWHAAATGCAAWPAMVADDQFGVQLSVFAYSCVTEGEVILVLASFFRKAC
jgi:hypothetical protein